MTETDSGVVKVFSARACAEPLEKAARIFEDETGARVEISVCSRHCASGVAEEATEGGHHADFLEEIAEAGIHDLAIGGAEYLLDDGELKGVVAKGERRTIACRGSAIMVPVGNPAKVLSVEDMAKPGVRVAISMIDCLKGLWEDICGRFGLIEEIRRNVTFRANGCVAIVEAVAEGQVDAAFGWLAFEHLAPGRIELVQMPEHSRVFRGTGIGLLTTATNPDGARLFMDFLATDRVRKIYCEFGWELPGASSI